MEPIIRRQLLVYQQPFLWPMVEIKSDHFTMRYDLRTFTSSPAIRSSENRREGIFTRSSGVFYDWRVSSTEQLISTPFEGRILILIRTIQILPTEQQISIHFKQDVPNYWKTRETTKIGTEDIFWNIRKIFYFFAKQMSLQILYLLLSCAAGLLCSELETRIYLFNY